MAVRGPRAAEMSTSCPSLEKIPDQVIKPPVVVQRPAYQPLGDLTSQDNGHAEREAAIIAGTGLARRASARPGQVGGGAGRRARGPGPGRQVARHEVAAALHVLLHS